MSGDGRAARWKARGDYFRWAPGDGSASEVEVFHVESGDPGSPVLLLVHGFPTCSVDWFEIVALLDDRYRVCALDFPGYGFSDKPLGWGYSIARDGIKVLHETIQYLRERAEHEREWLERLVPGANHYLQVEAGRPLAPAASLGGGGTGPEGVGRLTCQNSAARTKNAL